MTSKIPFNRPVVLKNSPDFHLGFLKQVIEAGSFSGGGFFSKSSEALLEKKTGVKVKLTSSATHALEMMALLMNLNPGDEIIVPSFTFSSTANAFALRGVNLRFADNDAFGNLLLSEVERLVTPKTKAVMTMHYAGNSCDMDELLKLGQHYKIDVLEDAAQALDSKYKDRELGSLGRFGCYSFHETKNHTAGEGGALLLKNAADLERAEILREKGTNRQKFLQGLVDKYTWVDIGSSYVLSELGIAYLWPQLLEIDQIRMRRKEIWTKYYENLKPHFEKNGAQVLEVPSYNTPNYHLFAAIFETVELRNKFIQFMREKGISCPFHYVALHSSPQGLSYKNAGTDSKTLKGCDRFSNGLVRLPLFYNLTKQEEDRVIESVLSFQAK